MHSRIIIHFLKSKKSLACQSVMISNDLEKFLILPNHMEIMGNGTLLYYVDQSNNKEIIDQKGIFHFKDSELFFI
jgi:hypothetical protein